MKIFTEIFSTRLRNANAVIRQLRECEWEFVFNPLTGDCLDARRGDDYLWVGNGAFSCEVCRPHGQALEPRVFGLLLRHYVWWAAARSATKKANKEKKANLNKEIRKLYE